MAAIILAAGRGTRMKSRLPKVLFTLLGKPIISYVLDSLQEAGIKGIATVAGYGHDLLKNEIGSRTKIVLQKKLLGSGDAVNTARKIFGNRSGDILVICGDTPLIKPQTLRDLMSKHRSFGASATVLTAILEDARSYGRIVKSSEGKVCKIVEDIEASPYEKAIKEVNVGTYCFNAKELFKALAEIKSDNPKGEYFLTDIIEILSGKGKTVESHTVLDPDEMIGINTRKDLAIATGVLKNKILDVLMENGVTIEDPLSTTIYPNVKIGRDTVIRPNTIIESDVEIERDCIIGPFARIRRKVRIGQRVEVGNFVELVRTTIGNGSKIKHHTYLGDTIVGKNVNIGAGTITANYDGKNKNKTVIEDGSFIGVGARLIAPVRIGRSATVGAGAVVCKNHNVPKGAVVAGVPARVIKKRIQK